MALRLEALEPFLAVGDEEGFAAAGRRLGLSPSAVSKHVRSLEDSLGVRLFQRTTRSLSLTEAQIQELRSQLQLHIQNEYELQRRHQSALGMTPAAQHLRPADRAAVRIHLRLELHTARLPEGSVRPRMATQIGTRGHYTGVWRSIGTSPRLWVCAHRGWVTGASVLIALVILVGYLLVYYLS